MYHVWPVSSFFMKRYHKVLSGSLWSALTAHGRNEVCRRKALFLPSLKRLIERPHSNVVSYRHAAGCGRAFAMRCHVLSSVDKYGFFPLGNGNSSVPSLSYCRPSRPPKLCSRLYKCTMFRKVCQMDMFRAGEIHEWSSRSEISS